MLVFIDESGDTGLDVSQGATKYFGVFMVVFEERDEALACDQKISLIRRELRLSEDYEFHFHRNSDRVREHFLKGVLPYQFFYYGIIINKARLFGEGFKNKESFYKYSSSLLFENAKDRLENAIVVIDESGRGLFKYQLASYLKRKLNSFGGRKHIKKVKMQDSKGNNLLQLVDMVAGAVNRSLSSTKANKDYFRGIIKPREIYVQMWPR